MPHGSGLAQGNSSSARVSIGMTSESSWDPPSEDSEKSQGPGGQSGPGFAYGGQTGADYAFHQEDDNEDDKDSVTDPPVMDRTYARLVNFILDRFAHSLPSTSAHVPPRCELEDYFAVSDPPPATRQNLTVYPRVAELVNSSAERASRLARESRPPHRVVPLRRKMFYIGDNPDYCNARYINPDFARISKTKNILKT